MDALENNLRYNFPDANNVIKVSKRLNKKTGNYFFQLPEHLIHAYYMLRHLKIRDNKIKIQYTLNYYRSIQRRLALDLNEMHTRDTVLGDQEFKPPSNATRISAKNVVDDASFGAAGNSKKQQLAKARAALEEGEANNETNESALSHINNLYLRAKEETNDALEEERLKTMHPIDKNKFRYKEQLRNKFISTCPVMSRYHTSFGYTMHRFTEGEETEYEILNQGNRDRTAKRFMGRADHVEFTDSEEILIKDDFGVHIIYDCVESDFDILSQEILLIGSYYIKRQEPLMDAENIESLTPIIDRVSTLEKLMEFEAKFQFKKAQLVRLYMEAYEHIVDSLEQQRFIQMVIDLMADRPRLNLDSNSFEDSYKLELLILDKKKELLQNVIRFQIQNETRENEKIADYLERAHKLINDSIKDKWSYFRPDQVNTELKMRGIGRKIDENLKHKEEPPSVSLKDKSSFSRKNRPGDVSADKVTEDSPERDRSPTKKDLQDLYKQKRKGLIGLEEEPEDRFSEALGLPKISQNDIYK